MSAVGSRFEMGKVDIEIPKFYYYTKFLEWGCLFGFFGCLLLLISFCSPYWLASWKDTSSPFLNLGLWTVCFNKFRHPHLQFDILYDGCYSMWGDQLRMISFWISPGWMIAIQVSSCTALTVSLLSQLCSAFLILRSPRHMVLRFEKQMIIITEVFNGLTGLIMLISALVFSLSCWSRDWLLYPNYNYLSWSFAFALGSILCQILSVLCLFKEVRFARERETKNLSLLYRLYPHLNPSLKSFDVSSVTRSFL